MDVQSGRHKFGWLENGRGPSREPHRASFDNLFPRCALIRGMHETSNADWWDARVTRQLTPLSLLGSLGPSLRVIDLLSSVDQRRINLNTRITLTDPSNAAKSQLH